MAWCHVGQDRIAVSQQSRPGEIQLLKLGADRNSRWRVIGEEVIRPGGPSPWRMQYSAWSEAFILHSNQDVRLYSLRHKKTIARLKPADPAERDRAIENLQIRFSKNGRSLVTTSNPLAEFQIYRLHRADQFDALPQPLQLPGHTFLTRVLLWNEDDFLLQDLKRIRLVSPNGIIERSFREGSSFGVFDSGGGMVVGTTALLSDDQSPLPRRGVAVISGDRFEKAAEWKDQTGFCPFALSPNGRILVDQENDGVSNFATFVDVETGRHLVFPEVYLDDHTNFLFSPDGNHFITFGHSDVRVWRTPLLLLEREDGTFERRSPALR